ncbi:hypothetical protein BJ165DRAFT_1399944 [Panaeolus papilionaceus]|nr:hypothetical protein BJ165DRAFT_1399944 [Panaeolus papilionaceus]
MDCFEVDMGDRLVRGAIEGMVELSPACCEEEGEGEEYGVECEWRWEYSSEPYSSDIEVDYDSINGTESQGEREGTMWSVESMGGWDAYYDDVDKCGERGSERQERRLVEARGGEEGKNSLRSPHRSVTCAPRMRAIITLEAKAKVML